jgi:hypothetical protein
VTARWWACWRWFHGWRLLSAAFAAPEGLWLRHIHHIGELANSSLIAPRWEALTRAARCLASAFQFHADEFGSSLFQSCQKPSTCLNRGMLGEATMRSEPTAFQLEAPRL